MAETADMQHDSRFDEAEADVDHGTPWLFREPDATNPLTIEATGWSTGVTKLGEAEFLQGIDRDGKRWSVLVGTAVLRKRLIDGFVEEWDNDEGRFVIVEHEGRVKPGEVVSIKYLRDREGAKYVYPDFRVSRRPPLSVESDIKADSSDFAPASAQGELPDEF
jgi:hypothetical protein